MTDFEIDERTLLEACREWSTAETISKRLNYGLHVARPVIRMLTALAEAGVVEFNPIDTKWRKINMDGRPTMWIDYVNYKGDRSLREIIPLRFIPGPSEWHPNAKYLIEAIDVKRGVTRAFSPIDILNWRN